MCHTDDVNGKGLTIVVALISAGMALILAMLGWLAVEQRATRSDVADLRERMARIEVLFEGHVKGDCE